MFIRLLPLLCLVTACAVPMSTPAPADDDDVNADDDDDAVSDDDDVAPDPELDCGDGIDDDGDGFADCLDDDCDGEFHCTWPADVELHTVVEFFAGELALEFGVGDCVSEFEGVLSDEAADGTCTDCDLEYVGPVTYDLGDCPEDYIEQPPAMSIGFGFLTETARQVWARDTDTAVWELVGEAAGSDGTFEIVTEEPVMYDVPLLGETEVGSFRLTRTLRDQ